MAKTEIQPTPDAAPTLLKTVVSVKATIPMQQYGNLEMFISQEILLPDNAPPAIRNESIQAALTHLRLHIAEQVMPLANTETMRCESVLMKEAYPDAWMQRNSPPYRWLRAAAPEIEIPAMSAVLAKKSSQ